LSLEIRNLSKRFEGPTPADAVEALRSVSFGLEDEEFVSIIGPSGCGKTTLLRIIAGLIRPSQGAVLLDGREIVEPGPRIGMVFQEYALLPWRTIAGNIEFGLEVRGVPAGEREARVRDYVRAIELEGFEDRYPKDLSGGMKQRVAIARTLINDPRIILMDEPFGSLDSQTRNAMQAFLLGLWEKNKKTVIFVTHNIDESVFLSQRVLGLSSRPGALKEIFEVDLPYPRDRTGVEFNRYRREILDFLKRET